MTVRWYRSEDIGPSRSPRSLYARSLNAPTLCNNKPRGKKVTFSDEMNGYVLNDGKHQIIKATLNIEQMHSQSTNVALQENQKIASSHDVGVRSALASRRFSIDTPCVPRVQRRKHISPVTSVSARNRIFKTAFFSTSGARPKLYKHTYGIENELMTREKRGEPSFINSDGHRERRWKKKRFAMLIFEQHTRRTHKHRADVRLPTKLAHLAPTHNTVVRKKSHKQIARGKLTPVLTKKC